MRDGARVAAALAVLADFAGRRVPLRVALADWQRGARYAGAKDRAFVSGLCLDALRRWRGYRGDAAPRVAMRLVLTDWGWDADRIAAAFAEEPHGPGALTEEEAAALPADLPDAPDWLAAMIARAGDADAEIAALSTRAPVDLRVNWLKGTPDKALRALAGIGAAPAPIAAAALRIPAPPAADRAPAVTVIPAYGKGLVEVQDEASQVAALVCGDIRGAQVLDLCAGGGGKALALSAQMANTGQVFAYDSDARRLAPIHDRLRRAGARNVQVRSPAAGEGVADLEGRMDVVLVDAPCSGTGTWRRRPDAKWRLTEAQLRTRMAEQDALLAEAARYVKPGGALVYATCSVLMEENEDRVAAFLATGAPFDAASAFEAIPGAGLTGAGRARLRANEADGVLRLSPARTRTDGFTAARLARRA